MVYSESMDEMVDIIDAQGRKIRTTSKQSAHQTGELHGCVIGCVTDAQGNIVVIRQASDKQDAGQWVNPVGGHMRSGESLEAALRREVEEEIGWTDFTFSLLGNMHFERTVLGGHENHMFYVFHTQSAQPILLGGEAIEVRAMSRVAHAIAIKDEPHLFGRPHHLIFNTFPGHFLAAE